MSRPPKTALGILRKAREILSKRGAWTTGDYACDKNGEPVDANDDKASRFCMLGALSRASGVAPHALCFDAVGKARAAIEGVVGVASIVEFNDRQTRKAPVLAAIDKAIAKLEAERRAQRKAAK